jgi:hypothetical protein
MTNESFGASLTRGWNEYHRGAAAFDLALVSLFAVVALGFRDAFAAGLWVGIVASIVLRSRVRAVERIPRAVLTVGSTRRSTRESYRFRRFAAATYARPRGEIS